MAKIEKVQTLFVAHRHKAVDRDISIGKKARVRTARLHIGHCRPLWIETLNGRGDRRKKRGPMIVFDSRTEIPQLIIYPFAGQSPDLLDKSLCINPGQLTKGGNGGTFANILIQPMKQEFADGDSTEVKHNIADRAKVAIQRI